MLTNRTAFWGETKLLYTGGVTVWALVVQIVDRKQELMSTAGLQSQGGGAGLGRGGLDREPRIVPSKPGIFCFRYAAGAKSKGVGGAVQCTAVCFACL